MKYLLPSLLATFALTSFAQGPVDETETPLKCFSCDSWNVPQKPFRISANTWYVGTRELSVVLVTGPSGHVLIDGAIPQSAAQIRHNIEALGFKIRDVKLIVNSHSHYDHAGGIPALQKMSGAIVAASPSGAKVLRNGTMGDDDPQWDAKHPVHVPRIKDVREVADGEVLKVGELAITAHFMPGHTPGATSWSWTSCDAGVCRDVVFADSLNPVSSGDFRFLGDATHPDISGSFGASIAKMANLKCDIVISAHPGFTNVFEKAARAEKDPAAFIDPAGCKAYALDARGRLDTRLKRERSPDWEKTK